MRAAVAVSAATLMLGLTACGASTGDHVRQASVRVSESPPETGAPYPPSPPAPGGPAQRAAGAEASRLLTLVELPGGASAISDPPHVLDEPVLGRPGVDSLADAARYWSVAMPFTQAVMWLKTHPPRGLSYQGSGSAGRLGALEASGFTYSAPTSPSWQTAELEVVAAPDGADRTVIRADGMVVWLDSTPMKDTRQGQRLHVSVDGPCPSNVKGYVGVTNTGDDLGSHLLPDGQPSAALVCEYAGSQTDDQPPAVGSLTAPHTLGAAGAGRIAAAVQSLSLSHPDSGSYACQADFGSVTIAAFRYAGRDDVDLWLSPTGCPWIGNGSITTGLGDVQKVVDATLH